MRTYVMRYAMPNSNDIQHYVLLLAFAFFALILSLIPAELCNAEEITLTTYYPSPYGVYSEMRLYPKLESQATVCDQSQEGLMFYDKDSHTLKVCGKNSKWENQAPRFFKGLGCDACPYGTQSFKQGPYTQKYCTPKDYDGTVVSFDVPPASDGGYACHSDYLGGYDIHFLFLSY